jgi:hypothetical protein
MRCLRLIAACASCASSLVLGACVLSGDDTPPPAIAGIAPANGTMGQTVTVEGDHFCPVPGGDAGATPCDSAGGLIRFGATAATTSTWTDTAIDAVVPPLAPGSYGVVITVGGRTSNTASFTVTP